MTDLEASEARSAYHLRQAVAYLEIIRAYEAAHEIDAVEIGRLHKELVGALEAKPWKNVTSTDEWGSVTVHEMGQ